MLRHGPGNPELVLCKGAKSTLSGGNLEVNNSGRSIDSVKCNVKVSSGRWYFEVKLSNTNTAYIGWATEAWAPNARLVMFAPPVSLTSLFKADKNEFLGADANGWAFDASRQAKWHANSSSTYGESFSSNDIVGISLDCSTRTMHVYRNGKDLGSAFTDLSGGALVPAASLSARQRLQFNFGKTPFAFPPPTGFLPLYSPVSEAERASLVSLFEKYRAVGQTLKASNDGTDLIKAEGTLQLGEDLGISDVTDPLLLLVAFKLGARLLWQFSADEWVGGWARYGVPGQIEAMKKISRQWQTDLFRKPSPPEFKAFYVWVFDYLKEDKKILSIDEATLIWGMLFRHRWPLLDRWLEFVKDTNMKAVSRDTWQQLYEFSETNNSSVSAYDPESSWPVAIDEFVEWLKKHP